MTFTDTQHTLLLALSIWILSACGQNKVSKVTVILFDNQNPDSKAMVDTLLNSKAIDLSNISVDLYFAYKNFHLPYYVPTDGIFKNAAKDKECDMKIYPQTVKCYKYDNENRVIEMSVNGSGTTNNFTYKYNDKNQVTEVSDHESHKFILTYNTDGTLADLTEKNMLIEKRLLFIYK